METDARAILKSLVAMPSPAGFETSLQERIRRQIEPLCGRISRDVNGNLIAVVNPRARRRILVSAHCDEVGLMVMHIDERGFLAVAPIGAVDPAVLPGRQVTIHSAAGPVHGVIGRKPIHHIEPEDRGKSVKIADLWVDIGASDAVRARAAVSVGDYATIRTEPTDLLDGRLTARGLDNRAGVAALILLLHALKGRKLPVSVIAVASVQEELGSRGARTVAFETQPDAGIAIDVGHASDYPGGEPRRVGDCRLGAGPILYRGPNIHPFLGQLFETTAQRLRIPHQVVAEPRPTPTEADPMQISRGGMPATVVKIPIRHMHTPAEVIAVSDIENVARLLAACLSGPAILRLPERPTA
jgi:endoglucanase